MIKPKEKTEIAAIRVCEMGKRVQKGETCARRKTCAKTVIVREKEKSARVIVCSVR